MRRAGSRLSHVASTRSAMRRFSANAFRFVVIDPKGIPDVRLFRHLIEPRNTEVLLNFMFQFANRFASSQDRMPTLEGWLGSLQDGSRWRASFAALSGTEREVKISERARLVVRF